jgi:hypothetical protein
MKSKYTLLAAGLIAANVSTAAYLPIILQNNSFNADVILESNAVPQLTISTTATLDAGTNNYGATLFEQGRDANNPGHGVPVAGSRFTAYDQGTYAYQMAPSYSTANGILVDSSVSTGAFTLVTPAAYTTLSVVCTGGNGGDGINVLVNHQDGSSETNSLTVPDWFGGPTGIATIMGGRITQTCYGNTEVDGTSADGLVNPRLYHRELTLNNTISPVTSVQFQYASGPATAHSAIFCLSGATTAGAAINPIAVTGYNQDFIWEASAAKPGRVMSQAGSPATTQTLDNTNNTGTTWYEMGYNLNNNAQTASGTPPNNPNQNLTGTGLPPAGSLITNAAGDHIFQMPGDYTTNNAVYLSPALTNATLNLATPEAYYALSFLGSAGNGPVSVNYLITHAGGSTETGVLTVGDWFNSSAAFAYAANGRVAADTGFFSAVASGLPRLLINDILLTDYIDPVVSIYLEDTNTTGGRIALLAVSGAGGAIIGPPPSLASQSVYAGSNVTFSAVAWANVALTFQWQRGTNGVFVNLADGGNISGSTTTNLSIADAGFADQGDYRWVALDLMGDSTFSSTGTLLVFSTNQDVTQPGDPINVGSNVTPFGDGSPSNAIANDMSRKFGGDFTAGTVPYLVIIPSAGYTTVTGLRIYAGNDSTGRDPSSFTLEGSVNGTNAYTLIASNAITLSDNRNAGLAAGTAPNPLTQVVTEVRFPNPVSYSSYRLSFPTQKGGANNTQVQLEQLEFLGVPTLAGPRPILSNPSMSSGGLQFNVRQGPASHTFSILTNSVLGAPVTMWGTAATGILDDSGNAIITLPASTNTCLFYWFRTP